MIAGDKQAEEDIKEELFINYIRCLAGDISYNTFFFNMENFLRRKGYKFYFIKPAESKNAKSSTQKTT